MVRHHCGRARQLLHQRDETQALDTLRKSLRLAPDQPEVHFLLARTYRRLGNLDNVEPLLRRALGLGGDPERVQRERWMTAAQSGRLREAEPHLAQLLADPRDDGADICETYVQGYFANLRTQEARQLLDAWQQDYPSDAQAYFMEAYLMRALDRPPEAIRAYRHGLELSPGRTMMRCRLAELLAETHEIDEANSLFRHCVAEFPENEQILTSWAKCLAGQGDSEQARSLLRKALAIAPGYFEALRQLGEIEQAEGRFEEALDCLKQALAQRPHDTTTHNAVGQSLRALGRAEEAQVHLAYVAQAEESLASMERQLLKVVERPDDVELRFEIGVTLLKFGSPEDGAKWIRTVLELQPDHAAARQTLAAYYESRGQWQAAAAYRQSGTDQ